MIDFYALVSRRLSPSYKNQTVELWQKAVEITNPLFGEGMEEGVAIARSMQSLKGELTNIVGSAVLFLRHDELIIGYGDTRHFP